MESKADSTAKVLPTALFEHQLDWLAWLKENHDTSSGLWLQLAKKDTGVQSVTYPEAVEGALCFGWIDGQKKAHDAQYWLQKFTPRADKSIWSKINKAKSLALIKAGKVQPAGLKAIERAKANGRWYAAYESAGKSAIPDDFQAMLDNNDVLELVLEPIGFEPARTFQSALFAAGIPFTALATTNIDADCLRLKNLGVVF